MSGGKYKAVLLQTTPCVAVHHVEARHSPFRSNITMKRICVCVCVPYGPALPKQKKIKM